MEGFFSVFLHTHTLTHRHTHTYIHNHQTKGVHSVEQIRDTTTEPQIAYSNSTWHAHKYKAHKLHRRYILKKGWPQRHICPPLQPHSATQVCMGIQQNQSLFDDSTQALYVGLILLQEASQSLLPVGATSMWLTDWLLTVTDRSMFFLL